MRDGRCLFEVVNGVPVVTAPEEIDITNTPELGSALLEAAAYGHGTLVVDMTRTQFCDSSGLHTLLAAHKRAQAEGGELLLAITAAPVLRVFAMTSIDRMIPNFTSLDEALAQTSANGSNGHQRAGSTLPDLPSDRALAAGSLHGSGQVFGHLVVVDGLAANNHVLPFQDHESLPLKEAPGELACLRIETADLLLACCRLRGLVELRGDPLPCRLGRTEKVVNVPVRLKIDEGNRAIVLVGR